MNTTKYTHLVIAQYAVGKYSRNEIISRHTSYELARKAATKVGAHFTALRRTDDVRIQGHFIAA